MGARPLKMFLLAPSAKLLDEKILSVDAKNIPFQPTLGRRSRDSGEIISLLDLRRQVQLAKEEERKRIQENSNQKPLNIVMFWLSTLSQRELTQTLFVRLLC